MRALAGQPIQISGRAAPPTCDAFGRELCRATLPGDSFRRRHDTLAERVFKDLLSAGIEGGTEPRQLFVHVLPQEVLSRTTHLGIIPDARLLVHMPPQPPSGAQPVHAGAPGSRSAPRDYLFDLKTISAGSTHYVAKPNGGAVEARARDVPTAYEREARALDRRHHGVTEVDRVGPVLTALRAFPPVRALVFGAYGEASSDVHTLLHMAAEAMAHRYWKRMGARTLAEALGIFVSSLRRSWGATAVREYARLRLNRLCYVGAQGHRVRAVQHSVSSAGHLDNVVSFSAPAFWAGSRPHWLNSPGIRSG